MLNDQKADFQALGAKRDQYNTMTTALNKPKSYISRCTSAPTSKNCRRASQFRMRSFTTLRYRRIGRLNRSAPANIMVTMLALALYIMYLIVSTALDKTVNSLSELKAKTALDGSGEFPQLTHLENVRQIFHNVLYADMIHSLRLALLNQRDNPATILVTSVQSRSGSSLIAELLAGPPANRVKRC